MLQFEDSDNGFEVDIFINSILQVFNSELLFSYGAYDYRFVKLALTIKHWNKKIFPDRKKRLNSFTVNLMLIAFLQLKGVLPNLQKVGHQNERNLVQY